MSIIHAHQRIFHRPRDGTWVRNRDSWQSQGLLHWYPGIGPGPGVWDYGDRALNLVFEGAGTSIQVSRQMRGAYMDFDAAGGSARATQAFLLDEDPCTFSCWCVTATAFGGSVPESLISVGDNTADSNFLGLTIRDNIASDPLSMAHVRGGTNNASDSTDTGGPGSYPDPGNFLKWVHCAGTKQRGDDGDLLVYLDGEAPDTPDSNTLGTAGGTFNETRVNGIARSSGGFGLRNGGICDVRIYNYAMTRDQVFALSQGHFADGPAWDLYYQIGRRTYFFFPPGGDVTFAASLTADADLSSTLSVDREMQAALQADADLSSTLSVDREMQAALQADADLSSTLSVDREMQALLDAAADLSATLSVDREMQALLDAAADLSATLSVDREMQAALQADADLSGQVSVDREIVAALQVDADLFCDLTIQGQVFFDAALAVDANLAASLSVERPVVASLAVDANLSADLSVDREIVAALQVTADLLASLTVEEGGDVFFQAGLQATADLGATLSVDRELSAALVVDPDLTAVLTVDELFVFVEGITEVWRPAGGGKTWKPAGGGKTWRPS